MKLFKKMLILNWHYISRQTFDLMGINFLTGKNASGKSTVIDAMQLLLLGDASGVYFNKAANDKSRRTLIGYAKGELSDTDSSFNYLRTGRFTTHIALEVYDDAKNQSFVIGFVMDVEGDNSFDKKYYWMDGSMPAFDFVRDNRAMSLEEIRATFKREGVKHIIYGTQTDYRNDFKVKMGHLNDKYFELFKKAVAFKPDVDMKRFITEFICETDSQVDISHMKENIRHYERLKHEAEDITAMVAHLEGIEAIYSDYFKEKQSEKLYGFLIRKGELEALKEELMTIHEQIAHLEDKALKDQISLLGYERELESGQLEITRRHSQLAEFEPYRIEADCKRDMAALRENNEGLEADISKILQRISGTCRRWGATTESLSEELVEGIEPLKLALREALSDFESRTFGVDLDALRKHTEEIKVKTDATYETFHKAHQKVSGEIEKVESIRHQLKAGIKTYEEPVLRLKALLEEKLEEISGVRGTVSIFCELFEIGDERWKNAIEGYLHTQKFNLIVEPPYFDQAIRLFEAHKHELKLYSVGLVDVGKIMEKENGVAAGSLAEEIRTDNPYAKAYGNYLLGQVMKCEEVGSLRRHKSAMTTTCMLYKNFVASQIHPGRYEFPYIGRQAVRRQLALYDDKLQVLLGEKEALSSQLEPFRAFITLVPLTEDASVDFQDAAFKQEKFNKNKHQIGELQKTVANLDMRAVFKFKDELTALENSQKALFKLSAELKATMVQEKGTAAQLRLEKGPRYESQISEKRGLFERAFDPEFCETIGNLRYDQELLRLQAHFKIRDNFDQSFKMAQNRREEFFKSLVETRGRFETIYRRDIGLTADHNTKYDALLKTLRETELPSFMGRIDEAIGKAQLEFKDDFISKLKSNIDTVNRQIDALNASLKSIKFGKDQYRFQVKPNDHYRKYYEMIMDDMLMNGFNLFSGDFQARHKEALDELFKKIVDVGEGAISAAERAELEKNIEKYTDYRTYLDFDLVVTDENGEKSHLSKMLNKKSGGETQTPFFISVLASFHRLYSLGDKRREDTIRLIIFDEAFSKMDHERIEESLKLLRDMKFQALISAPTEKIANIAPYADKTLCVLRSKQTTTIKEWDKQIMEG